jgi:hypothetical protein
VVPLCRWCRWCDARVGAPPRRRADRSEPLGSRGAGRPRVNQARDLVEAPAPRGRVGRLELRARDHQLPEDAYRLAFARAGVRGVVDEEEPALGRDQRCDVGGVMVGLRGREYEARRAPVCAPEPERRYLRRDWSPAAA